MADAPWAVNSIVLRGLRRQTAFMKPLTLVILSYLLLAACGPVTVYHKQASSVSRLKTDLLSCQVDALAKAPVATQVRQRPPYYVPSRRYCRSDGECYSRGGFFAPGEIYSVDVNARLRDDLEEQCMSRSGYRAVALPRCTAAASPATSADTANTAQKLPVLSETSCVARDATGDWQIITPKVD